MFDSILLALGLAVTGDATPVNRQASDSAEVSSEVTGQLVADVFEPAAPDNARFGQPQALFEAIGTDQMFRTEFESSSPSHPREPRKIDIREQDVLNTSDFSNAPAATPTQQGWDYDHVNPFFHDGQTQSVDGDPSNGIQPAGMPVLTFWQDNGKASEARSRDIHVEFAAANAMPTTVPIPLPSAAWSALSIMGGAGLVRGARRLRRQFH